MGVKVFDNPNRGGFSYLPRDYIVAFGQDLGFAVDFHIQKRNNIMCKTSLKKQHTQQITKQAFHDTNSSMVAARKLHGMRVSACKEVQILFFHGI